MILLLLYGPYLLLSIITLFCGRLFQLAGIGKSDAHKPIINVFYWFKIARIRPLFGILFFLPYLNLLFIAWLASLIISSYSFGVKPSLGTAIFWFIGLPQLNSKAESYKKNDASLAQWNWVTIDMVLFILIKRSIINTFVFSVFAIPTSSMEKTFMTGDLVFAERVSFGPRLPVTPLSLPFFHNHLPNSATPTYWAKLKLPYYRFPGSVIKRNDVVVFNYPVQTQFPVDQRDYYMKRCVALPGDTLTIVDAIVSINGKTSWQPPLGQKTYLVKTDGTNFEMSMYEKLGITDGGKYTDEPGLYLLGLTAAAKDSLKALPYVMKIDLSIKPKSLVDFQRYFYPADTGRYRWNSDQYGPLVIPKKGVTVLLNKATLSLYEPLINKYEGHKLVLNADSTITINGKPADKYTFELNYYFMMGDNRDNSEDSRFWGLVPEDHIDSKVAAAFKTPALMHRPTFKH